MTRVWGVKLKSDICRKATVVRKSLNKSKSQYLKDLIIADIENHLELFSNTQVNHTEKAVNHVSNDYEYKTIETKDNDNITAKNRFLLDPEIKQALLNMKKIIEKYRKK